jgi:transaldolase/glucose-6-phosphate isomerase
MHEQIEDMVSFANEIRSEGTRYVVLLGMGGSSLAPEVYQDIFKNKEGHPELIVLDSTHPSAIRTTEEKIDILKTIFLVSSKSGTTVEMLSLFRYFWEKVGRLDKNQGQHFVAISDPSTPLMELAKERSFRRVFDAPPDIGGRYSALTVFGLVPAALIGIDIHKLLDRSWTMSENCAFCVLSHNASGLELGAALGEIAKMGRDKLTFFADPSVRGFPNWIEQLIAESTGKDNNGIIPVVDEPINLDKDYGSDRFFIYLYDEKDDNTIFRDFAKKLESQSHPVIRINLTDKFNVGQEIFRWEVAAAAAGSILGIHPFNQPNVEMAKKLAREEMGKPKDDNRGSIDSISIEDHGTVVNALNNWINQTRSGDYISIQAYLHPKPETTESLQRIRSALLNHLGVSTTLGYGPRFLHSTGQLHKGGPKTGLFLQLIDEPIEDLKIPETNNSFNELIQAQALGDFRALKQRDRRVLRINLKKDVSSSLLKLEELVKELK